MTRGKTLSICIAVTAALLMASSAALATPINPLNSRPVPVTIPSPDGTGKDVQTILNTIYPGTAPNAVTGQEIAGMWGSASSSHPTISPIMEVEYAGNANSNILGIWSGTDSTQITKVNIFTGAAQAGDTAQLVWNSSLSLLGIVAGAFNTPGSVNTGSFAGINPFSFGWYLVPNGNTNNIFYSVDQLNPAGAAQMLAYHQTGSNDWVFFFEDLQLSGADKDYNDLVFRCESLAPVPEPGTLLLLGAGLVGLAGLRLRKRA